MKTKLWLILAMAAALIGLLPQKAMAGACTAARFHDWQDLGCNQNFAGAGGPAKTKSGAGGNTAACNGDCGMPRWWVSEPYINLCLSDTPLSYTLSSGQEMPFRFFYRQRTKMPDVDEMAGPNFSFVNDQGAIYPTTTAATCGTNACWGNNWNVCLTIWDAQWEQSWTNVVPFGNGEYRYSGPNYAPYTQGYQALVFRPDGGLNYYQVTANDVTQNQAARDPASQVGLVAVAGGSPQVYSTDGYSYTVTNTPTSDTNGIFWGDTNVGVKLLYPDGSQDVFGLSGNCVYGTLYPNPGSSSTPLSAGITTEQLLLTQKIDPQGRVTHLGYEQVYDLGNPVEGISPQPVSFRVRYVVDSDGRTNQFRYVNGATNTFQLSEIDDPYGRKVVLNYYVSGLLESIIDAVGMTNSFGYQTPSLVTNWGVNPITGQQEVTGIVPVYNGWITNLATPYGNTSFCYYQVTDSTVTDGYQQRAVYVTEPEGAQQLYYYLHKNGNLPTSDTPPTVPGQTFDTGNVGSKDPGLYYRNTFHWGRRQFAALASNYYLNEGLNQAMAYQGSLPNYSITEFASALAALGANDYNKARMRHWLLLGADDVSITESFSSERDPSPDTAGATPGLRTWYNYPNQSTSEPELLGNDPQIACVARVLPDGSSQYTTYNYYSLTGIPSPPAGAGFVSDNESSFSMPGGAVGELTNWYAYSTNDVDLLSVTNSQGQWVNLGYNGNHQITAMTNALGQTTTLTWDPVTANLRGVQLPSGQTFSLNYYAATTPPTSTSTLLQWIKIQPEGRAFTNNNFYAGLPASITDDRGVTVSQTWDGLNRLTGTVFPDGTSISNVYNRLDLVASHDRLTNWTYYAFDGLQHVTNVINANGAATAYSWCGCGSLSEIFDPVNGTANPTSLNYDNQGNLTGVVFPDNSSLACQVDLAGRTTNVSDGAGRALLLAYNNQGLVTSVTSANGTLESIVYDALNRPVSATDANGVTVTSQYDAINELLQRTWPDGISEGYGYSAAGLIAYTNRDSQRTLYGRDGAGREIAETNANQEVIRLAYDSLDNVTNLLDGNSNRTQWQYNQYGWLTNKIDGLGRNAFRYAYNANGWVTNRWTPEKGNTGYTYDNVGNRKSILNPQSAILYSYDALNRLTNMVDALGSHTFGWTAGSQLASESDAWTTNSWNYVQRLRTALSIAQPGGNWTQTYGYDSSWRMTNTVSPAGAFGYFFGAPSTASALVTGIALPNGANIVNSYDSLARLTGTALNNYWGHTLDGYTYTPDTLGLRTNIVRNLGLTTSTVNAGFDKIGQLTSWSAAEANGTLRQNEQLGFGYDSAHNLHTRTNGALVLTFIDDAANQVTNSTRTGTFTLSGATPAPATSVAVNGLAAQTNGDFTYARTNLTLVNGQNIFTNVAVNRYGVTVTNTLTVNLPQTVALNFDNNGNLTNDGLKTFAYDSENQLTNIFVPGQWRSDFIYDGLNRRRIERDYSWSGTTWVKTNETHIVCDGYMPIQERDTNNNVLVTYTRGLDLSGTLQSAGGIGGLLARTDNNGSTFYHADAAGNITALVDSSENIAARYLYNPFGKLLGQWGPMAGANELRFSSMPYYSNPDLYGFPGRFYDSVPSRWLNQDPIGERGGINLYGFVGNNPVNNIDPYGLWIGQGAFNSFGDWELNTLQSAKQFFTGAPGDMTPNDGYTGYRGGSQMTQPLATDENGNDATADVMLNLGLTVATAAIGGPEGEGGELLGGVAKTAKCESAVVDSEKIANAISQGHAYGKHVIDQGQYGNIMRNEFADIIQYVMDNPTASRTLSNGRTAFYDANSGTVVIVNPNAVDWGTAFVPNNPLQYFNNLK